MCDFACRSQQACIAPLLHLAKPIYNGKLFAAVVATTTTNAPTDNNSSKTTEQHGRVQGEGPSTDGKTSFAHTNCQRVSAEGTLKSIQSYQVTVIPKTRPITTFFPRQKACGLGTCSMYSRWTPCDGSLVNVQRSRRLGLRRQSRG